MSQQFLMLTVCSIRPNGLGNLDFELTAPEGTPLPAFEAGAHIDVITPRGDTRQYSLCNGPGDTDRYHLCVRLDAHTRGGSVSMHRHLAIDDQVEASLPRNLFSLPDAGRHLLVAAGIGITPILSMAKTLAARGADFELHYYVQSRAHAAFGDFLEDCSFAGNVFLHASDRGESLRNRVPNWLRDPQPDAALLYCGPPGFMARLEDVARQQGWTPDQLHSERFTPSRRPAMVR